MPSRPVAWKHGPECYRDGLAIGFRSCVVQGNGGFMDGNMQKFLNDLLMQLWPVRKASRIMPVAIECFRTSPASM
jgi:hypothetical protein